MTSLSGPRIGCVNSWEDGSPAGPGNGQHLLLCLCRAPCCRFSPVRLFATSRTVARQTPLSTGSSRQEYCSGLPFLPPGDLPDLGIKPMSLVSPALAGGFFTISATWETLRCTMRVCMLGRFSRVQLFTTLWAVAHRAPLSMEFSRQEYWSVLPSPPPGDLPYSGIKPASLMSPTLARFFTISATWETLRSTIVDFKLTRVLILHPSSSPLFCGNSVFSHPQASNSSLELQKKSGSLRPPVYRTVNEPHLL